MWFIFYWPRVRALPSASTLILKRHCCNYSRGPQGALCWERSGDRGAHKRTHKHDNGDLRGVGEGAEQPCLCIQIFEISCLGSEETTGYKTPVICTTAIRSRDQLYVPRSKDYYVSHLYPGHRINRSVICRLVKGW